MPHGQLGEDTSETDLLFLQGKGATTAHSRNGNHAESAATSNATQQAREARAQTGVLLAVARYQTKHWVSEGRDTGALTNTTSVSYKGTALYVSFDDQHTHTHTHTHT